MTNVYLERDGDRYLVQAAGHATGSREVCTSISTLMYTLVGFLSNSEGVEIDEEKLEPGDSYIEFHGGSDAFIAFKMVYVGFMQIEKTCPEYISVTMKTN